MRSQRTTKYSHFITGQNMFLLTLVIAMSIFGLAACSGGQLQGNANVTPVASPSPEKADADLVKPYSLGETDFNTRQEFVDQITPRCATEEPSLARRLQIDDRLSAMREVFPEERAAGSVEIPVYFHIITNAAGTEGAVIDADVKTQIDRMNAAYAGQGPGGTGAPTPFRFVLAATDRTANDEWFNMPYAEQPTPVERAAKAALNKGGKSALNLYTARLNDRTLGWARWPWDIANGVDGVVIRFSTLPGGTQPHYNEGDTATHEVGHWLGLFHTFQGGCSDTGDEVDDTPAEKSPGSGCPAALDTCPAQAGADPVENFMDYSDDSCMFKFSPGQSSRMDAAHLKYRR
jgi:hypothetical protein